ncbi:DUF2075 domain-containing protein [Flavobacterium sp. HJJ]|uniref:DUF2075 domain-containing protein n=1 Tax=Flavobacterium sp. HJJ TaxID=2783792 RepID=UPI00188A9AB4|nr:DUF2075 domain-containing protein [Flavobacterium sp. HJJ]MBF4473058.1 DUF2075 domain-containing protein [Flavobacterium sp. HJJ]
MIDPLFGSTLLISKYTFSKNTIHEISNNKFVKSQWPLIYIISSDKIKEAYVGESTNALKRMLNHLTNEERLKLSTLHLITSDKFNKSATLDIENNLIKYISADGKYILQNGNAGLTLHNYYQKDLYFEIFKTIWVELRKENLNINVLKKIDNSDLFKYSPYKSLSSDQYDAVTKLLQILIYDEPCRTFVKGSAGTGKTILAIYLIKLLKTDYRNYDISEDELSSSEDFKLISTIKDKFLNPSIALVIPMTSLRKTLKTVFRSIKGLSPNMVIGPSDVLKQKYDILIVDEAHRLKRKRNIVNYDSFNKNNAKLGLDENGTELDWILLQSKNQIFFYDDAQSVKPSDIPKEVFDELRVHSYNIELVSQMRVIGGSDYINYVDNLLNCRVDILVEKFQMDGYEFKIFDSLKSMVDEISIKEKEFGLSRMVAGFSWDWISKNDKSKFDIKIDGVELQWNYVTEDWLNSENSENEVGCIHTTQGYDLNYIGVIFGYEIDYDPITKKIIVIKENYKDKNGKNGVHDFEVLHQYIVNIYKTLMYRGIKGTFVYVCNENLRNYMKEHIILH